MPSATVLISTRNRREEVCRAVASALAQMEEVEVIVADDASEDGTAEQLSKRFPAVKLVRSDRQLGSLVHRNALARMATAPILISLDDDAELPSPYTVSQVLREFSHPRIAAVGIPFFDAPRPTRLKHRAPTAEAIVLTDYYLGCCAALDRAKFLAVGGYAEPLHHSGEEPDLCARWFRRGWVVRLGTSDLAIHHVSPRRASGFALRYATRNEWLNAFAHVPRADLPRELGRLTTVAAARAALRGDRHAVAAGIGEALRGRDEGGPGPMPRPLFRLWRRLALERRRERPRTTLDEIEDLLPSPA
ncbi:MAG TPA: glycosyltransferase family A protein [Solirubrobacterales bacterium]|jgi:GT2 family glycosyltransferase|nr:glycosyltransferase family A protein [Solirubrobacterales bacterium]